MARLHSGKAMAAYAALTPEDAIQYDKVKEAILRRYEVNERLIDNGLDRTVRRVRSPIGSMLTG